MPARERSSRASCMLLPSWSISARSSSRCVFSMLATFSPACVICSISTFIPAILRVDPCPGAVSDGIDALRVANEEVPSILAGGDDCLVAVPNTLAELIAAQIVPDVLHRVQVCRQGQGEGARDGVPRAQAVGL